MFIGQVEESGVIEPVVFPRVVPADEPHGPPDRARRTGPGTRGSHVMLRPEPVPDGIVPLLGYREWSIRTESDGLPPRLHLTVPSDDVAPRPAILGRVPAIDHLA